jgi:hypothetical protein
MRYEHTPTRSRWIVLLLAALACPVTAFGTSPALEQTLAAIEDCMAASPVAWPQGWRVEYIDAIRDALTVREEPSDYDLRLNALREGWHELRYARVDLMRQLGGEDVFLASRLYEAAASAHPHYLLPYRSW